MRLMDSVLNGVIDVYTKLKSSGDLTSIVTEVKERLNQDNNSEQIILLVKEILKSARANAQKSIPQIWDEILNQNILAGIDLSQLVCELSDDLSQDSFQTLLENLLDRHIDFIQIIQKTASLCLKGKQDLQKKLLNTWGPLLGFALKSLGPQKIATAIISVITSRDQDLTRSTGFLDLDLFQSCDEGDVSKKMFELPDFQLPAGVMLSGLGLQYLIQKTDLSEEMIHADSSAGSVGGLFSPLIQTIKETSLTLPEKIEYTLVLQLCMEMIKQAKENEDVEWALLKMARFTPVGIFLIIAAILYCLVTHPLPWWNLLFKEIEADPRLKVKRLPAPTKDGPKYIIFSDIHRDARSDQREPLEFGSFDHFSANQTLYCELLDYAFENGYTVVEAGDCDELWYYRDFSCRPREKLEEIVDTHKPVYDRLVKLHREGRYVRLYGNHDSCVRNPEIFEVLQKIFDVGKKSKEPSFEIYDFAIIEDVKTMDESIINFGLDSEPYKLKMPMIVAHGHQWDFWNCDHNNIIGKLIVSAIGTPIDFLDDPFKDAGGIAYSGSPAVQFDGILAKAFVLSNFPGHNPARKFAHHIQHQDDLERCTVDDVFFLETLAALSGATIAVRKSADSEETQKMNLLCLGHTHYPQSQPYFDLKRLLPFLRPWITKLESNISDSTHGIINPELSKIKSRYFNSGNVGWMEGVIWAIQVDETAQARLVYWTSETRPECPQKMDWELTWMDDELRKKLEIKKGSVLNFIEQLSTYIDPLIDSALSSVLRSLAMPFEKLLGFFNRAPGTNMYLEANESLTIPLCHVFLSMLDSEQTKTHTFRITIPDSAHKDIVNIKKFLDCFTELKDDQRMRLTCAWYLFSQSIPFLGNRDKKLTSLADILPDANTFVQSMLGLIVQLPTDQNEDVPIRSHVRMERNELIIQITTRPITLRRARAVDPFQLMAEDSYEQLIRPLWSNMIRLPDDLVYYENYVDKQRICEENNDKL